MYQIAVSAPIQILYARDRVISPWKNGGGTTSEVASFPPGATLDTFQWRVSIARVERGGPFSIFPGIDRTIALLDGRMTLTIEGKGLVELSAESQPLEFPGDTATSAEVGEPVTDLNVMTRRGKFGARMTRRNLDNTLLFKPGVLTLAFPLSSVTLSGVGALTKGDALLAPIGADRSVAISSPTTFYWVEIFRP